MQFQSPYKAGRTVVMLTGTKPEDILSASLALLTSSAQAQSRGDLVLIEPADPEAKVTSMESGTHYLTGRKGTFSALESYFYTRPWVYYGVIAAVIVVLSMLLFVAMRRWRNRRK